MTRAGKSCEVEITVPGWRDNAGKLYQVNAISYVNARPAGVDADLLSAAVTYQMSSAEGLTTTIKLAPPGAFLPKELKAQKSGKKGAKGVTGGTPWVRGAV